MQYLISQMINDIIYFGVILRVMHSLSEAFLLMFLLM